MDDVFSQAEGAEQHDLAGEFLTTAAFNKNHLLRPSTDAFCVSDIKLVSDVDPTLTVVTVQDVNKFLPHFFKVLSQNIFCQHAPHLNAPEGQRSSTLRPHDHSS